MRGVSPYSQTLSVGTRSISPVVGVVVLVFLVVSLSVTVGMAVQTTVRDPPPTASLTVTAHATTDRIVLHHEHGESLNINRLNVTVSVDGTPLDEQPPVPFFAAEGFESGPTGPFNSKSDRQLRAGESAGFRIAETNSPQLSPDSTVTVTVATEKAVILREEIQAGS